MASQAEVISGINSGSDRSASAAAGRHAHKSPFIFAARLAALPTFCFFLEYISRGGPFGGMEALRESVNAWAEKFITEAKYYELCHADKEKSIRESRDFD